MSSDAVLRHVEDAPKHSETPQSMVSRNRKIFGYAIGVLGLVVSGLIIFGLGHNFFPDHVGKHHLTVKERAEINARSKYETCLIMLPGKNTKIH